MTTGRFSVGWFAVLIALIVTSCLHQSASVHRSIYDENSVLLRIASCEDILEIQGKWKWKIISISQFMENKGERVMCYGVGQYYLNWFAKSSFSFTYEIIVPGTDLDENNAITDDFSGNEIVELVFILHGKEQYSYCEKNDADLSCLVIIQYDGFNVFARYIGDKDVGYMDLEQLFNATLSRLDSRIMEFSQ